MKIVLDTTVYIDYIRSKSGAYPILVQQARSKTATLYTPSIVILELWAGESMKGEKETKIVKKLISPTKVVELSRQLAESAGDLVRDNMVRDLEDATIAATALYLKAELATGNKKHFEKVKGLKLYE